MDEPQLTARPHVDVLLDGRSRLGQYGTEADRRRAIAACDGSPQKGGAEVLASDAGDAGERLRRGLESAIGSEHRGPETKRDDSRVHDNRRERARARLQLVSHGFTMAAAAAEGRRRICAPSSS